MSNYIYSGEKGLCAAHGCCRREV